MRILLVADVHSNWPALTAVREPHDVCLFTGDLVDYGVEPAPCIDWVRRNARYFVRGNHDHGAAQDVRVFPPNNHGFKYITMMTRPYGRSLLTEADRRFLATMPLTQMVTLDGVKILMVHATPRDPLDEFAQADAEFWVRRLEGISADLVCVGHSHQQYALEAGRSLVVNPGSIGLQRDGDPRAAYAVIDGLMVELKRVEYPVEKTVRTVDEAPLADDVKEMLISAYRTGRLPWQNDDAGRNGAAAREPLTPVRAAAG